MDLAVYVESSSSSSSCSIQFSPLLFSPISCHKTLQTLQWEMSDKSEADTLVESVGVGNVGEVAELCVDHGLGAHSDSVRRMRLQMRHLCVAQTGRIKGKGKGCQFV